MMMGYEDGDWTRPRALLSVSPRGPTPTASLHQYCTELQRTTPSYHTYEHHNTLQITLSPYHPATSPFILSSLVLSLSIKLDRSIVSSLMTSFRFAFCPSLHFSRPQSLHTIASYLKTHHTAHFILVCFTTWMGSELKYSSCFFATDITQHLSNCFTCHTKANRFTTS